MIQARKLNQYGEQRRDQTPMKPIWAPFSSSSSPDIPHDCSFQPFLYGCIWGTILISDSESNPTLPKSPPRLLLTRTLLGRGERNLVVGLRRRETSWVLDGKEKGLGCGPQRRGRVVGARWRRARD